MAEVHETQFLEMLKEIVENDNKKTDGKLGSFWDSPVLVNYIES